MAKSLEQIVFEGLAADCCSMEELFVLWQAAQQGEENPVPDTCYPQIDPRSFHIDGIVNPDHFSGVLYLLKEPSLKKYIQKGMDFPVVTDIRRDYRRYKKGWEDECGYLAQMQRMLLGEQAESMSGGEIIDTLAVMYINKRGGKEEGDFTYLNYASNYIEFIKKQIRMIDPKVIICCGQEIYELAAREVFSGKKSFLGRSRQMAWADAVSGDLFLADQNFRLTDQAEEAEIAVINMWSPADHSPSNDFYQTPEEYFDEFELRAAGMAMGIDQV